MGDAVVGSGAYAVFGEDGWCGHIAMVQLDR